MSSERIRPGNGREPLICQARIDALHFKIAIDFEAAAGHGGHPPDPIAGAYLRGETDFNLPLVRLMLALVQPGQSVLDVGAHLGTFALAAAAHGCRVCAVEASPTNAALLRTSARHNGWCERLHVIEAALGNRGGALAFTPYGPWGHVTTDKIARAHVEVSAVRLDGLPVLQEGRRWDFIKMDVEGSEVAVVEGAGQMLRRPDAPPLLYESNYVCLDYYDRTPRDLRAALVGLGYVHHYLVRSGRLITVAADALQGEIVGEYLATKAPVSRLAGWRIEASLSRRELLKMLLVERRCADPKHRLHLGRALREAPPDLLAEPGVRRILRGLKADPQAGVRAAVAWYAGAQEGKWTRLVDGVKERLGI
jgi:FkbM family methyltransferase